MPLNTSFKVNVHSTLFWQKYSSCAVSGVRNFPLALIVNNSKILPNRGSEIFRIVKEPKKKGSGDYYDVKF